ncbi:MAG: twin-arginine translocase TatA/TatE family subunit [Solirubrobacterales bacterium]
MLSNIGPLEIGIVLVIALVVFGPKRLPELGSSLGQGIRGFGKGLKGDEGVAALDAADESAVQPAKAATAPVGDDRKVS